MARDAATPSAPTERAAVSRGTKTRVVIGAVASATSAASRSPSMRPWTSSPIITAGPRAQSPRQKTSSTVRRPSSVVPPNGNPEALDGIRDQRVRPHGLARLGATDPQLDGPARRRPEVSVERDHAVDLGPREVQRLRDDAGRRADPRTRRWPGRRGGSAGAVRAHPRGRPRSPGRDPRTTVQASCGLQRASSASSRTDVGEAYSSATRASRDVPARGASTHLDLLHAADAGTLARPRWRSGRARARRRPRPRTSGPAGAAGRLARHAGTDSPSSSPAATRPSIIASP